jgi:type IV secretory pathway TrbD component
MSEPQASHNFGYSSTILRGVWERILTFGAPRFFSQAWAAMCLFAGLVLLTYWGWKWLAVPLVAWIIGHGTLVALTSWNTHWDEMALAQMNRRYKGRYSAG